MIPHARLASPVSLTWRLVRRGTAAWSAMSAVSLVAGATVYRQAYPTAVDRARFAASFGASRGLDALYGRADAIDTISGFLWWRYSATLAVVVALWGILATTRVVRGDEEQGRIEPMLSGPWPPDRWLRAQLGVLLASVATIGMVTALSCAAAGLPVVGSAAYGAAIFLAGAAFVAMAACVSQLVRTRRRAVGVTGSVLGVSYLVRALADGAPHLGALAWCSPLGWVARMAPFAREPSRGASAAAIVLLVALATSACLGAIGLRGRRDLDDAVLARSARSASRRHIRSLWGLDVVQLRPGLLGWCTGTAIGGLVLGFIAADIASVMADNPALDDQASSLTGRSLATVRGFVGLSFGVIAVVAALYAGAQLVTARRSEADGSLVNLLTNGVGRRHWFVTRVELAAAAVLIVVVVAAVSMWAGVRLSGRPFALGDSLRGGLNTLPVAAVFLGFAALALGAAPRAVTAVAYGAVAGAYTLLLLTALGEAPRWLVDVSPFSHLAPVPAAAANVPAAIVLLAVAAGAAVVGALAFERRDIATE